MQLYMQVKEPGPGHMSLKSIPLDLSYARSFSTVKYPDAYERLLMDVVRGNLALFMGQEEVRAAWAWTDDVVGLGSGRSKIGILRGRHGWTAASLLLLDRDGRAWWQPEEAATS